MLELYCGKTLPAPSDPFGMSIPIFLILVQMALVSSSTSIKKTALNATYFACYLRFYLMPYYHLHHLLDIKPFVSRGLTKWNTIAIPSIGNSSKL